MPRNNMMMVGLRVLLIQKNLKHAMSKAEYWQRLRGLLIQKM